MIYHENSYLLNFSRRHRRNNNLKNITYLTLGIVILFILYKFCKQVDNNYLSNKKNNNDLYDIQNNKSTHLLDTSYKNLRKNKFK